MQREDVEYENYGITSSNLLEMAVLNKSYPPTISCAITYREELKWVGKPVFVHLDIFGAGRELSFKSKAYEETDYQNGELE